MMPSVRQRSDKSTSSTELHYKNMTMIDDEGCYYSRCKIIEAKMAIGFCALKTTIDQQRRRRRQRLLQVQRKLHATTRLLRQMSSSASTFYFLFLFFALSASSCCSFSFSSRVTTTITPKALARSQFGTTISGSLCSRHSSLSLRQRTLHRNMSAVADVPQSSSAASASSSNSFQRRMENLVRQNNSEKNNYISMSGGVVEDGARKYSQYANYYSQWSQPPSNNHNIHNLKTVHTLQEYKQVLDECRQEGSSEGKIVVVRFYATWCKACKAIQPSYHRLATLYPNMIFLEVPVTNENANLHQGLEVPSLPYGHIYHPMSGLVEELKISRKYFHNLIKMVKWYEEGMCNLEEYVPPSSSPPQKGPERGGGTEVGDGS